MFMPHNHIPVGVLQLKIRAKNAAFLVRGSVHFNARYNFLLSSVQLELYTNWTLGL